MTFDELIKRFAEHIGLEDFEPDENGVCQLISEETAISIIYCKEINTVLLTAPVMELPADAETAVLKRCMTANFMYQDTNGGTFSLDPQTNLVTLSRYASLDILDDIAFFSMVTDFSTALRKIQQEMADGGAVQQQPDENYEMQNSNEFMRV